MLHRLNEARQLDLLGAKLSLFSCQGIDFAQNGGIVILNFGEGLLWSSRSLITDGRSGRFALS